MGDSVEAPEIAFRKMLDKYENNFLFSIIVIVIYLLLFFFHWSSFETSSDHNSSGPVYPSRKREDPTVPQKEMGGK